MNSLNELDELSRFVSMIDVERGQKIKGIDSLVSNSMENAGVTKISM